MKLKNEYVVTQLEDEYVAVPVGEVTQAQRLVIYLNKTGIVIWQGITDGLDEDGIVQRLVEKFRIDEALARMGVRKLTGQLREHDLLEP